MINKLKLYKKLLADKGAASTGTLFIVIFLIVLLAAAFMMIGGTLPSNQAMYPNGQRVVVVSPVPGPSQSALQLETFSGVTPTPPPPAPSTTITGNACENSLYDSEEEVLQGSDPAPGGTISSGAIRVWAKDENPLWIGSGQTVNGSGIPSGGNLTALDTGATGNHSGSGYGSNGAFFWTPTLFICPSTATLNAQGVYATGATPGNCKYYFPDIIRGDVSSSIGAPDTNNPIPNVPAVESDAGFQNGPNPNGGNPNGDREDNNYAEFTWTLSKLVPSLTSGTTYIAEYAVHDGDTDLAVDCVTVKAP